MMRLGTSSGRRDANSGLGDKESGGERGRVGGRQRRETERGEREGGRDRERKSRGIEAEAEMGRIIPHARRSMLAITLNDSGAAIVQAASVKFIVTGLSIK